MMKDSSGEFKRMVIILHDMSKEKEADKVKSEFISTITHELRTPLTSIEGFVSLILARKVGDIPPKQEEFLNIVQAQSKNLKKMIQNLLEFSRFVTGKMKMEKSVTLVKDVLEGVLIGTKPQIEKKKLDLSLNINEQIPDVMADSEKLAMVISNIIGNAIKFSHEGGKLTIKMAKDGKNLLFSVSDTGLGLSKENLEKIFERFYQVDSSLTRKVGGAGVGLAVAKEIVEAHGGRIWAESAGKGKGVTVSFTLPIG